MNLKDRFKRLTFWNKLGAVAALITIIGPLWYVAERIISHENTSDTVKETVQEVLCTQDTLQELNGIIDAQTESLTELRQQIAECAAPYARTAFEKGQVAMGQGAFREAMVRFDDALALVQSDSTMKARIFFYIGNCYFELGGLLDSALMSYDTALFYRRNYPEAWVNRGFALVLSNRPNEALRSIDSALTFADTYARAWYNRGAVLASLGRFAEALTNYDAAIAIDNNYIEAWVNRTVALAHLGFHKEALASYDNALARRCGDVLAWTGRGTILGNLGEDLPALMSFDSALTYDPDCPEAWQGRGVALRKLGRLKEAI